MHQPAGRVVDEHKQRALRPAILKPPMLATVDLHQFSGAFAPVAGLMNALQALFAIEPQPSLDHPKAKGLAAGNEPGPPRPPHRLPGAVSDGATAQPRSSKGEGSRGRERSRAARPASRPPRSDRNPSSAHE